jgi:hypothetical protein
MKFKTKPVTVDAVQWNGDINENTDLQRLWKFCPEAAVAGVGIFKKLKVPIGKGEAVAEKTDWIVRLPESQREKAGKYEVWTDEHFRAAYDLAEEVKPEVPRNRTPRLVTILSVAHDVLEATGTTAMNYKEYRDSVALLCGEIGSMGAALGNLQPFVMEDYYPNCCTPPFKAAVEAMNLYFDPKP